MIEPVLLSIGALAAELGLSRDVLRRVLNEAGVAPAGKRSGYPLYRLRDVYRALRDQGEAVEANPHARLALARAIQTELATSVRRRELIELHEHERTLGLLAMFCARAFETAVDNLERDVGLSPRQAEYLERHFDQQREALALQWAGDDEQEPKVNGHDETYEARP